MAKKRIVMALGHDALGTNLPEQKKSVAATAKLIADFIQNGWQVAVVHSNAPQVGMIHTAMNELCSNHEGEGYTPAPMSVCSAMSQGYIGYDLQNGIRSALLKRGIYKPVSTVLTQVMVDPYDESFYNPVKKVGRYMTREEADAEEAKGNYVTEVPGKGWQRIVSAPKPVGIVEIDTIRTLMDADQIVISCGGGVVKDPANLRALHANGIVLFIDRPLEDLLVGGGRPLSTSPEALKTMEAQRRPLYLAAADAVIPNKTTPADAVTAAMEALDEIFSH